MRIHILGICGTFMGSLAVLAKQLGHEVSGSDQNVYPPMSTQLEEQGITLCSGYSPDHLADDVEMVVIGNTCSRGNEAVEYVLDRGLPYCSGPQWLAENVLKDRWVLAVAGTHGKTTTTSMLTWILEYAELDPGYLIGGVPKNFDCSARLGSAPFFVIEADEYDSAFFDKRSKFIHYQPRTVIMGNLEFDHADIFDDLAAIQTQFHHLVKTIPQNGLIISPSGNENLEQVFEKGVWSEQQRFDFIPGDEEAQWQVYMLDKKGSQFSVKWREQQAIVQWELFGKHNVQNGVAAIAAAAHAGVDLETSCRALSEFAGVKRRLELIADVNNIKIYDDFAHHPTAIQTTLQGFRASMDEDDNETGRLIAVVEARSNTMKMGYHQDTLGPALECADLVVWYKNTDTELDLDAIGIDSETDFRSFTSVNDMVALLKRNVKSGDRIIIMSNGSFEGLYQKLSAALEQ